MKHFEDTWEEAEKITKTIPLNERIDNINNLLSIYKNNNDPIIIGEVLFEIAGITKQYNINIDAALNQVLDDIKIDNYE
jgi:hypothetical protein